MDKPKIPKEAGKLKWLCNEAFFSIKRRLPVKLRETRAYDRALAFTFGALAGYGIAFAGKEFMELINETHHNYFNIKEVTSHCLAGTVAIPLVSYAIAPNYIQQFISENPRYSAGSIGVMMGASVKALETLLS
ncbi:hypothetical protein HYV89_00715 [Candidatus Woesearchaeota archaeon]|nr:hypothetical protein [Candidatus Woesearchaeota archaeon]